MMVVEDDVAAVKNQWDPKAGPKLDFNEDYYSILEVDSSVSPKELKKVTSMLLPDNTFSLLFSLVLLVVVVSCFHLHLHERYTNNAIQHTGKLGLF